MEEMDRTKWLDEFQWRLNEDRGTVEGEMKEMGATEHAIWKHDIQLLLYGVIELLQEIAQRLPEPKETE